MQISTALFLNAGQVSTDKKVSKESLVKAFQNTTEAPSSTPSSTHNIKEVVTNLLGSLASEAKSKSAVLDMLQATPLFKNMGNFSNDIKSLIVFLKSDPIFEKPLLFLQNFQKSIEIIDAKILKEQVQNSGLFLESKLANKITKESLQSTMKSLLVELKEHLSHTNKSPLLTKELVSVISLVSNPKELSQSEFQTSLKNLLGLFRQSVKEHLSFEAPTLLKQTHAVTAKLDQVVKEMPLLVSKIENSPDTQKVLAQEVTSRIKELLITLKNEISNPQNSTKELLPMIETLLQQPSLAPQITSLLEGEVSIQEQLTLLTNRLKQHIELSDPQTLKQALYADKSVALEQKIVSLLKPEVFIAPSVLQKLSINPEDIEILSDMKGILTSLNHSLATSSNPKASEAFELSNKLLTQIDYHQLVSYVSSSTHLYIPFTWSGLNGGSMQMKQTKDDHFHCQIDLDLEHYGKINMMLMLSNEKYIDITIATQKSELKEKVSEHLSSLKKALNEVGLISGGVKIIEYKETKMAKNDYFADEALNFGINITI